MRASSVDILKCYLCTLDAELPEAVCSEIRLAPEDDLYAYSAQLLASNMGKATLSRARFREEDWLAGVLPTDADGMDQFVPIIAERVYDAVCNNPTLRPGSGICIWAVADEQPFIGFFKLNFQSKYMCYLEEDGRVSWHINSKVLPGITQKDYEFFIINVLEKQVEMSAVTEFVNGEKTNYLAAFVLQLHADRPEKETVKLLDTAVVETIRECYKEEEAPQKIMEYKADLAYTVAETGTIDAQKIQERVFADNEIAIERYQERAAEAEIPVAPIRVSKPTERSLQKKQKIVTDIGIELLIPVEFLQDDNVIAYEREDDGSTSIVIKSVRKIQNK